LGLISDSAANSDSNERILLYDMWKILEGDKKEEVTIDDLKYLIMGILRFSDNKRLGVTSIQQKEDK
jgi:hypothetical protein